MGAIIKLIPMFWAILTRGKVLASAHKSKTTQKQYVVVVALCMALAGVGYFVPVLADDAMAGAIITLLLPLASRLLLYKEKIVNTAVDEVPLVKVSNPSGGDSWILFEDTIKKAREKGYHLGVGRDGTIWDIATGEPLGMLRLQPECTEEEKEKNRRAFRKAMDALKTVAEDRNKGVQSGDN